MRRARTTSSPSTQPMAIQLAAVIFVTCLSLGVALGIYYAENQKQSLAVEAKSNLNLTTQHYAFKLQETINDKLRIAQAANNAVQNALKNLKETPQSNPIKQQNGALRQVSANSAAFMPNFAEVDDTSHLLFSNTNELWNNLAPAINTQFSSFYLITKKNFMRISPPRTALMLEASHDLTNNVIYQSVTPENNPKRQAVWTPLYQHPITQEWISTLAIPIYINNTFTGVTATDYAIEKLFTDIYSVNLSEEYQHAVIFNKQAQIITHSEKIKVNHNNQEDKQENKNEKSLATLGLTKAITHIAKNKLPRYNSTFNEGGKQFSISAHKIHNTEWYVSIYNNDDKSNAAAQSLGIKIIFYALAISTFLATIITAITLHFVAHPIKVISLAMKDGFSESLMITKLPESSINEINTLKDDITHLFSSQKTLSEQLNIEKTSTIAIHSECEKLKAVINKISYAIIITDAQWNIEYTNEKFKELTGYETSEVTGKSPFFMYNDVSSNESFIKVSKDGKCLQEEIRYNTKDNYSIWCLQSISPIIDSNDVTTNFIISFEDVSDEKNQEKRVEELKNYDSLTGLYNRDNFKLNIKQAIENCEKTNTKSALLYFDLINFKNINDTLGHDTGDTLLKTLSNRVSTCISSKDVFARIDGDEFAILLNSITEKKQALAIAIQIKNILKNTFNISNNEINIQICIGIVIVPDDATGVTSAMRNADLTLQQSKTSDNEKIQFFSSSLNEKAVKKSTLEKDIREALKNDNFVLYYQPIVDIKRNKISSAEALIRWPLDENNTIQPNEFIPAAEASGQILEIGEWVLRTACQHIKKITPYIDKSFTLSVNLSTRQLRRPELLISLNNILKETGISPKNLCLEITESMLMDNIDEAITLLHELRETGVSLSIDDFGTGYSSLSYLKKFPVNTLKIDRAFIKDIPQDKSDMAITAAVIAMGKKLNLKIIAEGVETVEQLNYLLENSCDFVQGFYFFKPMPAQDFSELMQNCFEPDHRNEPKQPITLDSHAHEINGTNNKGHN